MSKLGQFKAQVVVATGVEYHVWRKLNSFITWGHMMTDDAIRYTESNVISFRNMKFSLNYLNRRIVIERIGEGEIPSNLVAILKQVADDSRMPSETGGSRQISSVTRSATILD